MMLYSLLLAIAALFVWLSGRSLPPRVAAHFNVAGNADGFVPHDAYLYGTLGLAIGLPLVLTLVSRAALANPNAELRLPGGDYWLSPRRRNDTVSFLQSWIARLGILLALLVCFVHWLVVKANRLDPPHLANSSFYAALIGFGLALVVWINAFFNRFRSPE